MHRGGRDAETFSDPGQRPSVAVEPGSLVDVLGAQARVLVGDADAGEDLADCSAVDGELGAELVVGVPGPVGIDQCPGLLSVELAGVARRVSPGSLWRLFPGLRELPEQLLQGADLGFRVVIGAPQLHHVEALDFERSNPGGDRLHLGRPAKRPRRHCGPDVTAEPAAGRCPGPSGRCRHPGPRRTPCRGGPTRPAGSPLPSR